MANEENETNNELAEKKEALKGVSKSIPALHGLLKNAIVSVVYGTKSNLKQNKFNQCICTLSLPLIEFYRKKLNYKDVTDKDIAEFRDKKYTNSASNITVYDLIEGKKTVLYFKNKIWAVQNYVVLDEKSIERVQEFIQTTWPNKTSKTRKKEIKNEK